MSSRKVSLLLSIIGALMFIGGTIYFIIGFVQTKGAIEGLIDKEEITSKVQPFISSMLLWVLGNFLIVTFVNGAAAMAYSMKSNFFKGDALFVVKIVLTFIPIIMCGVYFLITLALMP